VDHLEEQHLLYMLQVKFILGIRLFERVTIISLPSFHIVVMHITQKKIKDELVLKIVHQK